MSLPSAVASAQNLGDHSSSLLGCLWHSFSNLDSRAVPGLAWGSFDSGKSTGSVSPLLGVKSMDTINGFVSYSSSLAFLCETSAAGGREGSLFSSPTLSTQALSALGTQAQRGKGICPESHSKLVSGLGPEHEFL